MTSIFKHKENSKELKKILIPQRSDITCKDWIEVCIDYKEQIFTAKKLKDFKITEDWEELHDYTFPSSLLNEFLNSD